MVTCQNAGDKCVIERCPRDDDDDDVRRVSDMHTWIRKIKWTLFMGFHFKNKTCLEFILLVFHAMYYQKLLFEKLV